MTKIFFTFSFRNILGLVLLAISCMQSSAQPFVDVLNLHYQYFLSVSYSDDAQNNLATAQEEATLMLPMVRKNKDVVLIGGDFTQFNFTESGDINAHSTLYSTSLALGYDKQWKSEKWRSMLMVLPKMNAGFKNASSGDLQMGGILLFNYKKKQNLKYHFGIYFNHEYFGNYFIPLLGIDWSINKKFNLFGDLPANMNIEYCFDKHFYAGAAYQSFTTSYRASSGDSKDYVRQGDKVFGDNQLKIYMNGYITPHIMLFAEGGRTLFHYFQFYNAEKKLVSADPVFRKTIDGFFLNAGLALRFRQD